MDENRLRHGGEAVAERQRQGNVARLVCQRRNENGNAVRIVAKAGNGDVFIRQQIHRGFRRGSLQHQAVGGCFHVRNFKRDRRVDAVLVHGIFRI
ncbi:hypothetical protein SDC9_62729 [bioreactor metagenome]|uniref:Uncharacterized protein n=1 Tax=bioreactor metagenome TaxID=1076179 RepID=A0A644XKH8_9ZZZZ